MREPGAVREVTADEVAQFRACGWALLRDFVAAEHLPPIAAEVRALIGEQAETAKETTGAFRRIWRTYDEPSYRSAPLWGFATSPSVGRAGSALLGGAPVRFLRDEVYVKMPTAGGEGRPTPWHQDFPYGNRDRSEQVNLWIALEDIPVDGGALRYLSGSHRRGALGRALDAPERDLLAQYPDLVEEFPVSPTTEIRRGDVLAHHGLTVHGAPANTTASPRWAYTVVLFHADSRYTGVPWPRRLAGHMGGIAVNEPFDHPLTPVVWPPDRRDARSAPPLTEGTP
ncbi:phytanoyl-CoA dioxygenase family protein [Actinokineospora soli]|uniref:Phytanoyl-CoA dioxygenase family protein n=1 Tax=Actinokineospora soli TaxID=1048753 RepID=A0ABW2TU69_9PSEU